MNNIEKNCRCCYRIKMNLHFNYKVLYQDRWLATFEYYSDADNFIAAHINADYENKKRWNTPAGPMEVKIVK